MGNFYFATSEQVYQLPAEAVIADKLLHSQLILDELKARGLYEDGTLTKKGKENFAKIAIFAKFSSSGNTDNRGLIT